MTREQLTTAVVGAALTLAGAIILSALQAIQRSAEERRIHQREWHKDLVDFLADFEFVMIYLTATMSVQEGSSAGLFSKAFESIYSDRGLLWRMQRLERGHPDPRVRDAMSSLVYAIVHISGFAHKDATLHLDGTKTSSVEKEEKMKVVIVELKKVLDRLTAIIHGGRTRRSGRPAKFFPSDDRGGPPRTPVDDEGPRVQGTTREGQVGPA
ncbi:hypothetical protein [Micromonospora tulbaghiae]|uniref:hypothetical protein n=1 Tax=Micromonospora tulbaghiae TaxID=479978 RepID=UPI0034237626